ncbi:MAG: AEC family transporter [Butyricicoccaceae bacterium]
MLDHFLYSLNATLPVFALMVLGWVLKRARFLNDEFIRVANRLVFNVALPCMLFLDIAGMDPSQLLDGRFVAYGFVVTLLSILGIWALTRLFLKDRTQVGAFVQGAYRSSAAILGAALITNIYGDAGYAPLMILASVPLYNVFAVLILVLEAGGGGKLDGARVKRAALNVCKNPIILGILAGMPFALLGIPIPAMASKCASMLGSLATPLALLAIGAGFVWGDALQKAGPTVAASAIKLVVLPALFLPVAVRLGFRNEQLMAILIMLGSPSTPSGYIMAKQMGNDGVLANGIVVLTTLLAAVTITGWIFLLRTLGLL